MHASAAVHYVNKKELEEDPQSYEELVRNYDEEFSNPYIAAERGIIDAVVEPTKVRKYITSLLAAKENKSRDKIYRKHGNVPL